MYILLCYAEIPGISVHWNQSNKPNFIMTIGDFIKSGNKTVKEVYIIILFKKTVHEAKYNNLRANAIIGLYHYNYWLQQ
jgi:hypothetical protein